MKSETKSKLAELKAKLVKYEEKLRLKMLLVGEADGPNLSRFPTGRFELDQEIEGYQILLTEIKNEIRDLEKK